MVDLSSHQSAAGRTVPTYVWRVDGSDLAFESFNDAALEVTRGGVRAFVGRHATEMYADSPEVLDLLQRCRDGHTIVRQRLRYRFRSVAKTADLDVTCTWVPPDRISVSAVEHPSAPPRGTETVLLVEDEAEVRALARELLEGLGYTVLEAGRPREAIRIAEQHRGPIHLVLTDVVMPEFNGRRLAEHLMPRRADMKVLYMSGYADDAIVRHGVLEPGTRFLEKPFSAETLADKVREVLDETAAG